jgi:hypothetical protein
MTAPTDAEGWTPGPYRAGRYSSMLGCPVMAQPDLNENSIVLCSVYGGLDAGKEECEATARLFAAAPDLVKAATSARKALATAIIAHSGGLFDADTVGEHPVVAELDAALNRATGK